MELYYKDEARSDLLQYHITHNWHSDETVITSGGVSILIIFSTTATTTAGTSSTRTSSATTRPWATVGARRATRTGGAI